MIRLIKSDPEKKALQNYYEKAFADFLNFSKGDEPLFENNVQVEAFSSSLQKILNCKEHKSLISSVIEASIAGTDATCFAELFAGIDQEAIPKHRRGLALSAFLESLHVAVREEAGKPDSPLKGHVDVSQIYSLPIEVNRLAKSFEQSVSKWIADHSPISIAERAGVQNYFASYTEIDGQPTPFGGRRKELRFLHSWLLNEEAAHRLGIFAPAGRVSQHYWCNGLVKWKRQVVGKLYTFQ